MTQKQLATALIGATLYKKQPWSPEGGLLPNKQFLLTKANTLFEDHTISIDYSKKKIFVDNKALRLPKALSTDLLTIVRLKITKLITKNVSIN